MKTVLFLDVVHPALELTLRAHDYLCIHDFKSDYDAICTKIDACFGIVIRSRITLDRNLFAHAKNLSFVARSGAGMENIDLEAAKDFGVQVFNSPEGNRDAVGEHGIAMLLNLFNHLNTADAEVRRGIWHREKNRGIELAGKTVGIIGFGHTGSAFAKKLSGFDCQILAYDKYKTGYAPAFVTETSLDKIKDESDIVSIHLPLSEETKYYVDARFISSCAKPFYLINTARGLHVKTSALLDALDSGAVLGACLDVLEFEKSTLENLTFSALPKIFRNLASRTNVLLSPHVAGWTDASYEKLSLCLAEKILEAYP